MCIAHQRVASTTQKNNTGLGKGHTEGFFVCVHACSVVSKSLRLYGLYPPGSSVHGVFQARILEWVAISSSRGSSGPRDRTHVSCVSCIGRWVLYQLSHWGSPMLRGGGIYLRWTGKASLIVHLNGDNREVILERVTLWLQDFYPRFFPCLGHSATRVLPGWVPNLIQVSLLHTSFLVRHSQTLPLENPCTLESVSASSPYLISAKGCSNYRTIALISHASKVMLKVLQARLQQYMNCELPNVQAGFRKGRETRDQIANIHWIIEKAREFQKNIYFCFDYSKAFDCVDHNKLWKILKEMAIPDHLTCLLRNLYTGQEATVRTGHRNVFMNISLYYWFSINNSPWCSLPCVYYCVCVCLVTPNSFVTPVDWGLPGSSMGFFRQEYLENLPLPRSRGSSPSRVRPESPTSPALAGSFSTTSPPVYNVIQ